MNRLFRTTVVETSGVRTISGGGTNASNATQALLNLGGVSITGDQTISGVKTFRNLKIGPTTSVLDQTVDITYYNNNWRLVSNNTANSEIIESALVRGSGLPGYGDSFWVWRFNTDTNLNYDNGVLQLNNADAYDDGGGYPNSFKYFDISVLGSGYNEYFYLDSQSGVMRLTRRPTVNGTGVLLSGEASQVDLSSTVRTTGNQTVSGVKAFVSRPTVNGTGVLLSGEAIIGDGTIMRTIRKTQAEYNALSPVDPTTFYVIIG